MLRVSVCSSKRTPLPRISLRTHLEVKRVADNLIRSTSMLLNPSQKISTILSVEDTVPYVIAVPKIVQQMLRETLIKLSLSTGSIG